MLMAKASGDAITNIESIIRFLVDERPRLRRDPTQLAANERAIAYWRAALTQRRRDAEPS
jgi:hypothetical protein